MLFIDKSDERYFKPQLPHLLMQQIDKRFLIPGIQLNLKEVIGKGSCDLMFQSYMALLILLGQFGVVYRGVLIKNDIPQPVAIKTIKSIMKYLSHSQPIIL